MGKYRNTIIDIAIVIAFICTCIYIYGEVRSAEAAQSGVVKSLVVDDISPLGRYDWATLIIAMSSLLVSFITFTSQDKVARNTRQVSEKVQQDFLYDLVRHLYRNMVVMWAITNMMRESGYKFYPSSLHLLKAQVPLDNLHPKLFVDNDFKYKQVNKLLLQMRNYNIELTHAAEVFADSTLSEEVKEYYVKTLLLKPGQLTNLVVEVLAAILPKGEDIAQRSREIIKACHEKNVADNEECERRDIKIDEIGQSKYFEVLYATDQQKKTFVKMLQEDAFIECGKNTEGGDKLLMIEHRK